ncbi:MAG: Spy/CpxP family protein refolding chaperone [Terriglobales bacterium]
MKRNKFKMLGAVLALLLMAGFAISQDAGTTTGPGPGAHRGFRGGEHMFGFFSKALDLTDAQKAQIKQIISNEKPTLHPLMLQEGQAHQQMMQLVTSGNFDESKAQAIISQEAQTHSQLEMEHARIMAQAYQVLTPDQKTKFAEMQAKHAQRMQRFMQLQQSNGPATPNQ